MSVSADTVTAARASELMRWGQLVIGVICMVMIANLQYGWTFFVPDIQKTFGWDRASIQIAFTLFVLFETWLVPIEGWFVDKYGPKIVIFIGGVLCGIGWVMNSYATSLTEYYAAQIIAGIGAAGFGAGSALTVAPIQAMIASSGFQATFFNFGIGQGVIVCILAFFMNVPKPGQVPDTIRNTKVIQNTRQFSPGEIIGPSMFWIVGSAIALVGGLALWAMGQQFYIPLALAILIFGYGGYVVWTRGQPVFTLMYFMFVMVGAGGLMVTANLAPISQDLKIATVPVTIMWLTMPALTFAATIDRVLNGLTRPFFGWVSDNIGRENTMFIAFGMEGIGIFLLYKYGADPVWFVILSGLVFFAWGEIYSLFPSTCTDTFGSKFAATNAGLLYTAKGTAALLVPYSNSIQKATGSWDMVFIIAAGANILAAVLAIAVLKPWRQRILSKA